MARSPDNRSPPMSLAGGASLSAPRPLLYLVPLNGGTARELRAVCMALYHPTPTACAQGGVCAAATDPVVDPSAAAVPSDRFAHWLRTNDLLPRLRAVQLANDRGGALSVGSAAASFDNGNGDNEDEGHDGNLSAAGRLQLAMTLRDCSCFLRVPADPDSPVEAKLGDLDKKNLAAKLRYWQQTEMRLIEGGYYDGKEVNGVEVNCRFGRDRESSV